ncbi:MAG TPA: hypothetical protein VM537_15515, partial [Anaerolineae bacterium]|nr:hypothetical protein [Anaerolineae bacterium]
MTTTLARVPRVGAPLAAASLLSRSVSPRWDLLKTASVMTTNPSVGGHAGDPLRYLSVLLGAQEVLDKIAVTMST